MNTAICLTTWWSSLHLIYGHRKVKMDLLSFCNCLLSELLAVRASFPCGRTDLLSIYSLLLDPLPVAGEGEVSFNKFRLWRKWVCINLSFQHPPWEAGIFVPVIKPVPYQLLSALCTVHMKHGSGWSCSLQGQSYLPLAQCSCNTSLHSVPVPLATSSSFHCPEAREHLVALICQEEELFLRKAGRGCLPEITRSNTLI